MITPRLNCIINHVSAKTVADIGCDHAYIPIRLIQDNRAEYVIAADLNEGPLKIAQMNIEKYNLSDKIETRLGSGLSILLENEADTIIIAGMGGEIIEKIIRDDILIAKASRLLLQPMNSQYELRKYLVSNGFKIDCEDLALEGFKVYNIMEVSKGYSEPYQNEIDYQLPPSLYGHKYFKNLYDKKEREFSRIVNGLSCAKNFDDEKYQTYKHFLKELKNI